MSENSQGKKISGSSVLKKALLILITILLCAVILILGVVFIIERGPSPTAKELFVRSVNETSAMGFLGSLFLDDNEVAAILSQSGTEKNADLSAQLYELTATQQTEGEEDIWATKDDDHDGIIIEEVTGSTFVGYMMIVKDPMRVQLAIDEDFYGYKAHYVEEYVEMFDAVGGVNGGGFVDDNGQGNGAESDSLVVFEGKTYSSYYGTKNAFVGIDDKGVLHVDCQNSAAIAAANIQYGCAYGPILVRDGKIADDLIDDWSGLNPRTAIGQRADGAILLLVIDGRHVVSLGAQYSDLANVMLDYGAVCAGNMDGGSSTAMIFHGERLNNKAAVLGARPCPNAWIVRNEEDVSR